MAGDRRRMKTVTLGITGASGVQYAFRLLEVLLQGKHKVDLIITRAGQIVVGMETSINLPGRARGQKKYLDDYYQAEPELLTVYGLEEWTAPMASGSTRTDAMVICPCTMGTLSQIAVGASSNLLERAADVMLKEKRKLIIVPRETPQSDIHLENMLKLSRMGTVILQANPGFYNQPDSVQDLIDFIVSRILDHMGIENDLQARWGE